jgi:hypothetical protein
MPRLVTAGGHRFHLLSRNGFVVAKFSAGMPVAGQRVA